MSSNINWMDNKVMNPANSRQTARATYTMPSDTAAGFTAKTSPVQQNAVSGTPAPSTAMPDTTIPGTTMPGAATMPGAPAPGTPLSFQQGFPPATEKGYVPYYLASNIGKNVRAEFFIGGSQYSDRIGKLIEVGISYFVLEDVNSRTHVMCDLYSVKFVTVLQDDNCIIA